MAAARLLPLSSLEEPDLRRWAELAARAAEPNPFFEPGYALPLARAAGQLDDTALLVSEDGQEWQACLPVRASDRWHRVPLRNTSVWRAHVLYALLGTPLVGSESLDAGCDALVEGLLEAPRSRFSGLEWQVEGGPVLAALRRSLEQRRATVGSFEAFERAFLARRPQQDYTEETVSPKHRRELRRQQRKLGEELGEEVTVVDASGEDGAIDELIELEASSELAARGSVLASDPAHAEFFRAACRSFAREGRLQLLALRAGSQTLALKCNLVSGQGAFMVKIAFDERYRRYSPGMQLETAMLNFFQDRPKILWMDSCADPNNEMINRFWPDRRALTTLVVSGRGPTGQAAQKLVAAAAALRNRDNTGD